MCTCWAVSHGALHTLATRGHIALAESIICCHFLDAGITERGVGSLPKLRQLEPFLGISRLTVEGKVGLNSFFLLLVHELEEYRSGIIATTFLPREEFTCRQSPGEPSRCGREGVFWQCCILILAPRYAN